MAISGQNAFSLKEKEEIEHRIGCRLQEVISGKFMHDVCLRLRRFSSFAQRIVLVE
jgi:hypothetical protein